MEKTKRTREIMKKLSLIILVTLLFTCKSNDTTIIEKKETQSQVYVKSDSIFAESDSDIKSWLPSKGVIPNELMAVKIAELILTEIYGKEQIREQKPFLINLDNNIWVIEGNWHHDENTDGGVVHIEINKMTGEVLKIYHGV